jgi:hypothetical protein
MILMQAKRLANEQGENEFLFSCVNCFLGLQEHLIQYFNKWAYVQVCTKIKVGGLWQGLLTLALNLCGLVQAYCSSLLNAVI